MGLGNWLLELITPTTFNNEKKRQRDKMEAAFRMIDSLNVDDEHKGMFVILLLERGITNIDGYEKMLEFIGNNSCDVIKALIYRKKAGIETINKFAMCKDPKRREAAFRLLIDDGIKGNEEEIDRILFGDFKPEASLFDMEEINAGNTK